jgi:hypothetical protein
MRCERKVEVAVIGLSGNLNSHKDI